MNCDIESLQEQLESTMRRRIGHRSSISNTILKKTGDDRQLSSAEVGQRLKTGFLQWLEPRAAAP